MLQTILIKPASALCNMKCDYCFYCDQAKKRQVASYGMMELATAENIIRKVLGQGRADICFAFQGGEPTLRGLDFFKRIRELEEKYNIYGCRILNTLQTNGLSIDRNWCDFLKKHEFLVGVSLDGNKFLHDLYRHDKEGGGTYERVRESIRLLGEYEIDYNILTVVTLQTAQNIKEIYREYKLRGWNYQQYITCLDPFMEERGGKAYSLSPEAYGQFLIQLFSLWYKDWRRGKSPYIRQFENYVGILLGYPPEACEYRGMCSIQCVTEADGSVYPCDFYVGDQYRLGNFNKDEIADFFCKEEGKSFVKESQKWSKVCRECEFFFLCRSGCQRSRIYRAEEEGYRNYFCRGLYEFFSRCRKDLEQVAKFVGEEKKICR